MPLIGAHVSAAGGLENAIKNGETLGVEAIQIFGASPRQWFAPQPKPESVKAFIAARKTSKIKAVYLHAPYLVNLAATESEQLAKSIKNLSAHLQIAKTIEANGLIFHIGSGKEMPKNAAMKQVIVAMKEVLKNVPGDTQLIMENAAGGGQKIGVLPEDFGIIMRAIKSKRLKVCVDTAHAFEAGLIESYIPANIKKMFNGYDKEVGVENVVALHANDSKTLSNSKHDRHENIGQGHIGLNGFKNLAKEKSIAHTAWLLEVPGFEGLGPDKKNVDILKSCLNKRVA